MNGLTVSIRRALLPIVALVVLLFSWMLVRPVGGFPDDSFHFANIWCDEGVAGYRCVDVEDSPTRLVPNVFTEGSPWWEPTGLGENLRQPKEVYPSLFYAFMRPLAGDSVVSSVVAMRFLNVLLSVAMLACAVAALSARRRFGFMTTWLAIAPGLGLFYLASNHPFAWLYLGAGTGWAFTCGLIEATNRRRAVLPALGLGVAIMMMVGSRPEGQVVAMLSILVGVGVSDTSRLGSMLNPVRRISHAARLGILVASSSAMLLLVWFVGRGVMNRAFLDALDRARSAGLLSRLVDVPYLYMLVVGANVSPTEVGVFGAQSAFLVVAAAGIVVLGSREAGRARVIAALTMAAVALIAPLAWGNLELGVVRTPPRYLFVLALLTIAAANAATRRSVHAPRAGWGIPTAALVVGHSLALHGALRSYRVGEPPEWSLGLNGGLKWWWQWGPSPQSTWLTGTLAFGVLVMWVMRARMTSDSEVGS